MRLHTIDTPATLRQISSEDAGTVRSAAVTETRGRLRLKEAHKSSLEFRIIFAAAFLVFLIAAAFESARPTRWSAQGDGGTARKSIVERAKESASIAAGYAFMG
jgi:hypothetical protein